MAPQMPGAMQQFGRQNDNAAMASRKRKERDEDDSALFGDLPEGKKRKFILVDDTQKNSRVRVKVTLDQVNVQDIPDSYRKQNSVYPRSYYPMQMQSEPEAGRFNLESPDVDGGAPTIGRMTVPCTTSEGESQVEVSQLTRSKRERERNINELGYRMAWGQGRVFSNRPIFLARACKSSQPIDESFALTFYQWTHIAPNKGALYSAPDSITLLFLLISKSALVRDVGLNILDLLHNKTPPSLLKRQLEPEIRAHYALT